jgi:hypothetical protein
MATLLQAFGKQSTRSPPTQPRWRCATFERATAPRGQYIVLHFTPIRPGSQRNRSRADTTTRAAVVPPASPPTLQTIERLRRSRSQSTVDCASTLVLLLLLGASCWLGPAANGCASRISLTGAHTTPEQPHLALRRSFFLTSLRRPSHLDGVLGVAPP